MSESNNTFTNFDDLAFGVGADGQIIKSRNACTEEELSLPDGIHDAYISEGAVVLIVKENEEMIELAVKEIDLAKVSQKKVAEFVGNIHLGITFRQVSWHIKSRTNQVIAEKPTQHLGGDTFEPEFEFTIQKRDGSTKIITATRYNLDVVLKEIELEEENEARLGAMCDNMETDIILREAVSTKEGLDELAAKILKQEIALHKLNLTRIASGQIAETKYRRNFN